MHIGSLPHKYNCCSICFMFLNHLSLVTYFLWSMSLLVIDAISVNPLSPTFSGEHQQVVELGKDSVAEEVAVEKTIASGKPKAQNYVSHSAVALRCRVMPPPCIKNPYLKDVSEKETDPFGNQRLKCAGIVLVIPVGFFVHTYCNILTTY